MHIRRTVGGVTTDYYPDQINPLPNYGADFIFASGTILVQGFVIQITPTCPLDSLTVTMDRPQDGAYYFTCPDNDYVLPEQETHTPTSGTCVPTIQWKEDLLDQGGGMWHTAQDIHTAPLMPQTHDSSWRKLVVQVKAENPEQFVAMDRATITLYKAQDRPPEVYRDSINAHATAAANDVGVDVDTFKMYMKAILCVESNWGGYFGYCGPKIGYNTDSLGNVKSRDWGIAAINDFWWTPRDSIADPRGGVLFGPIDDNRRKWDPFYGIRFQSKLLSRFFLLMRASRFRGLTLTQKFQNAVCMYNAGEKQGVIWSTDPAATDYTYKNDELERLIVKKPQTVENMFNYLGFINKKIQSPCYPF